jgi:hypothetical protein
VTDINTENLKATVQSVRRSALTKEQVFRLWRCAVKDDDRLVDEIIQHVYADIMAFDCGHAEYVMELIIRRNVAATCALKSLLKDIHAASGAGSRS